MDIRKLFRLFVRTDWPYILSLFFISLATKGYRYGWYDQHLEIPLLKKLIDPSLYSGDYYVESLTHHFTSFFYPILAKIISIDLIPVTYFVLYLITRFLLLYWMFKIWRLLSDDRFMAFSAVFVTTLLGFTPEFMYTSFSHQEFTIAFVFAGLYYFFRDRYYLAAAILGVATNFHALYCLFPMIYIGAFLLWKVREKGIGTLLKTAGIYLALSAPFVIWAIQKRLVPMTEPSAPALAQWYTVYKIACPQNFIFEGYQLHHIAGNFSGWLFAARKYILILVLLFFHSLQNRAFQNDKKTIITCAAGIFMLIISYVFTYTFPSRLILDLNLIRNVQFMLFFLMGYYVVYVIRLLDTRGIKAAFLVNLAFSLLTFDEIVASLSAAFIFLLARALDKPRQGRPAAVDIALKCLLSAVGCALVVTIFHFQTKGHIIIAIYLIVYSVCCWLILKQKQVKEVRLTNRLLVMAFLLIALIYGVISFARNYTMEHTSQKGFWKLQRDWVDVQHYVRENTPKDSLLLVPYDMEMGGFRIFSERKIICSYRDCGIVGFDYNAVMEWLQRVRDIEPFKVIPEPGTDLRQALGNALFKYKVDYILFMKYYAPTQRFHAALEKIYENQYFVLYKVNRSLFEAPLSTLQSP